MTVDQLKEQLAAVLEQKEEDQPDWASVEFLSERTYIRLTEPGTPQNFPQDEVISYLAGFNRRRSDQNFAKQQRRWLRAFLDS